MNNKNRMNTGVGRGALAAAVALLLHAPSFAQAPLTDVQPRLYGKFAVGLDSYAATGASGTSCNGGPCDYRSRMRVFDSGSMLGIRGGERLGDDLWAIFQIETGVNTDTGNALGQNGITNQNSGTLASRDSFVGLRSLRFGQLTFGRQSVYWYNGGINEVGSNLIAVGSPLATANFSGLVAGPAAREANTAQYTGALANVLVQLSYSLPSTSAAPSESVGANQYARERIVGATLRYNFSPTVPQGWPRCANGWGTTTDCSRFEVAVDWAKRYNTNQVEGRDASGIKIGGAYRYGASGTRQGQISLIVQRLENSNTFGTGVFNAVTTAAPASILGCAGGVTAQAALAGTLGTAPRLGGGGATCAGDTLRQDMFTVAWDHPLGSFYRVVAEYSRAGNVKGSRASAGLPDSGVQAWSLGMRYEFSRRTAAFVSYSQIRNGSNNYVDFWGAWMSSGQQLATFPGIGPTSAGADPRIVGLGLRHYF